MYLFRKDLKAKKPVNITVPNRKIKMGLNESALDFFPELRSAFLEKMEKVHLNRYFNEITQELYSKLSRYAGVDKSELAFGNGADEMLYYIFTAVREDENSFALSLAPSYFDYKSYSGAVGLKIKFLSLETNFDFDVERFLAISKDKNCKLLILCNPNNPTGNLLDEKKIIKILESTSKPVMIDETYFEFSQKSFADEINKFSNLIIVRSFSKSFSAAGLRFGYLISTEKNINELKKVMTIFHLNLMTQTLVTVMLDYKDLFWQYNRKILKEKKRMLQEMNKVGKVTAHPSATNFIAFNTNGESEAFFEFLMENNIAIRPVWHHPILRDHLRVTISDKNDNDLFLKKMRIFFATSNQHSSS